MDYNLGPAQGRPPVRFEDLDEDARSKVTRILIDAVKEHQSVIDALRLPREHLSAFASALRISEASH